MSRLSLFWLCWPGDAAGPAAIIAMNAANEVAVAAFLSGHIAFVAIHEVIDRVLNTMPQLQTGSVDEIVFVMKAR